VGEGPRPWRNKLVADPTHACLGGARRAQRIRAGATLIRCANHLRGARRYWHNLESRHCGISTDYGVEGGGVLRPSPHAVGRNRLVPGREQIRLTPGHFCPWTGRRGAAALYLRACRKPALFVGVRRGLKRAAPTFRSAPLVPPLAPTPTMIINESVVRGLRRGHSNVRPRIVHSASSRVVQH
jgi:hypothetical protein